MMVAMAVMGIVKVAVDEVADMVAVGHGFVAAAGTVDMVVGVAVAIVSISTLGGVFVADGQGMLVVMIAVGMM